MLSIRTSRLQIRPFDPPDIDAVALLMDGCFGPAPRQSREQWLSWSVLNYRCLAELRQPPYGEYAITLGEGGPGDGLVIGAVGLVPCLAPFLTLPWFRARLTAPPSDLFTPEVGLFWAVSPVHRGFGYATEAAAALAGFAFSSLRIHRLVATTEHDNVASTRVMQKLGMIIQANPHPEPHWFQKVGILPNPTVPGAAAFAS